MFLVSGLQYRDECLVGGDGRESTAFARAAFKVNSNKNLLEASFKGNFRIITQSEMLIMETFCDTLGCISG